jgi:hypothetical protein
VPVYSHVFGGNREVPVYLTATLSLRNTDLEEPIVIESVTYRDSEGRPLKEYLAEPVRLRPFGVHLFSGQEF